MAAGAAVRFGTVLLPRHRNPATAGTEVSEVASSGVENAPSHRGRKMSGFGSSRQPGVPDATDARITETGTTTGTLTARAGCPTASASPRGYRRGLTLSGWAVGRTNVVLSPDHQSQSGAPLPSAQKTWQLRPADPAASGRLASAAKTSQVVAQLLLNRGVSDAAAARAFLDAPLTGLHPPELLPGVDRGRRADRAGRRRGPEGLRLRRLRRGRHDRHRLPARAVEAAGGASRSSTSRTGWTRGTG